MRNMTKRLRAAVVTAAILAWASTAWSWPMPWCWGPDGQGGSFFAEKVFDIGGSRATSFRENGSVRVQLIGCNAPSNLLWPGEKPVFDFQIENLTDQPISIKGKIDVIRYGLRTPGEDFFKVNFVKLEDCGSVPLMIDIPAKGYRNISAQDLPIPETFGGYGIVVDCGRYGRLMGATTARVIKPAQADSPKPYPRLMMDSNDPDVLSRLGAASNRLHPRLVFVDAPDFADWYTDFGKQLRELHDRHVTTTLEFGGGPNQIQPLGQVRRGFKDLAGNSLSIPDNAWLPQYDKDFQELVRRIAVDFGWPKGPIVGVKLFNEPWEGGGIDGWGADSVRYREMYAAMALGVEQARSQAGSQVLVGGCDSTSNTFDKLFADGSNGFLKWFDFHSMHYQGLSTPAGYRPWMNRKDANGNPAPVRMWDTESWVANSDERVGAVLSAYCSVGYQRVVGIFADGFIRGIETIKIRTDTGTEERVVKRPWSPCAAVAGFSHMIGERPFRELLFKNGLPWVMVFDGNPAADSAANAEDGTVVVVGDLGQEFNPQTLPFRSVKRTDAKMIIKTAGDAYGLYDSYANPVKNDGGQIILPLDGSAFYLRGDGKPGSFQKLLAAIKSSRIEGIEPVEIKTRDLLAPISEKPTLRVTITNVLNRPINGSLSIAMGGLTLENSKQSISLELNQTREVSIPITAGTPSNDNSYPLKAKFDAGDDGHAALTETMHVNVIPRMTPTIDGKLDDWRGAFPQPVVVDGVVKPSTEELAWRPWEKFETKTAKGFAVGYLAYDDQNFYFAAKIADDTTDEGMHRMENANDDEWFFPETSVDKMGKTVHWPSDVRRFSYAKAPELPSGNFPNRDNVQIGFNVLRDSEKDYLPFMPGTRPEYGNAPTNDYEYALNLISAKYGGGTEIWRLRVPGMPPKNFYPHQPQGPLDGAVKGGKLVITRDTTSRYVECAIPWSELPFVKRALDENRPIKFTFRVNDNAGIGCMELARERSIAKRGSSFSVDWIEHWTNEVEFAFHK